MDKKLTPFWEARWPEKQGKQMKSSPNVENALLTNANNTKDSLGFTRAYWDFTKIIVAFH